MSKEKQIDGMAKLVAAKRGYGCNEKDHCDMSCQVFKVGCIPHEDAKILYEAGYRQQSEAEWVDNHCAKCGMTPVGDETWTDHGLTPPRFELFMRFCPLCGAKMKGGAE